MISLDLRKKLLPAALASITLPLGLGLGNAVQNTPPASFEVASIKPSKPGSPGVMLGIQAGGRFTAKNVTVEMLLEEAYHVTKSQIAGAPSWTGSDHFDIAAKPEDSIATAMDKLPPDQRFDQIKEMVQSLLADRFKLVLSHETRELPVYFLVVGKNGPKFHPSTYQPPAKPPDGPAPSGKGRAPGQGIWLNGRGKLTVTDADISMFANVLARNIADRIVIDKTGLTGKYDFSLHWTPEGNEGQMPPGAPPGGPDGGPAPPEEAGPSLFTALQEQLGLKLDSAKAPVEILAIQHVEKPSEN